MKRLIPMQERLEIRRRLPTLLGLLDQLSPGNGMSRLAHSLQMATRARRAQQPVDVVVAALCHDIGHLFPYCNHARVSSEMLAPFVAPDIAKLLRWHTLLGGNRLYDVNAMEDPLTRDFVNWDITSWDTDYGWDALETFYPEMDEVFVLRLDRTHRKRRPEDLSQ